MAALEAGGVPEHADVITAKAGATTPRSRHMVHFRCNNSSMAPAGLAWPELLNLR
jgi:hypothetical protein